VDETEGRAALVVDENDGRGMLIEDIEERGPAVGK
jgi:hypothetical protein